MIKEVAMNEPDKTSCNYWYNKAEQIIGNAPEQQICKSVRMRMLMCIAAELAKIYDEGKKDGVREYNSGIR